MFVLSKIAWWRQKHSKGGWCFHSFINTKVKSKNHSTKINTKTNDQNSYENIINKEMSFTLKKNTKTFFYSILILDEVRMTRDIFSHMPFCSVEHRDHCCLKPCWPTPTIWDLPPFCDKKRKKDGDYYMYHNYRHIIIRMKWIKLFMRMILGICTLCMVQHSLSRSLYVSFRCYSISLMAYKN